MVKKIDSKYLKSQRNRRYYLKTRGTPRGELNERNKRRSKTERFLRDEATADELEIFQKIIDTRLNND